MGKPKTKNDTCAYAQPRMRECFGFLTGVSFLWLLLKGSVDTLPERAKINEPKTPSADAKPAIMPGSDLFETLVKGLVQDKKVGVKVGVLTLDAVQPDTFWFEFDPTVRMTITPNRWMLPFAASTENSDSVPFHIHNLGGCSSMLMPSGASTNLEDYRAKGHDFCQNFANNHPESEWKLWDGQISNLGKLEKGIDACYRCQDPGEIKSRTHFPAIALENVIRQIPLNITILDIDAQGMDVAILESIGNAIKRVQTVRLECQDEAVLPLYKGSEVPNTCQRAAAHLKTVGFELANQDLNNCGCAEFNLIMTNKDPVVED